MKFPKHACFFSNVQVKTCFVLESRKITSHVFQEKYLRRKKCCLLLFCADYVGSCDSCPLTQGSRVEHKPLASKPAIARNSSGIYRISWYRLCGPRWWFTYGKRKWRFKCFPLCLQVATRLSWVWLADNQWLLQPNWWTWKAAAYLAAYRWMGMAMGWTVHLPTWRI